MVNQTKNRVPQTSWRIKSQTQRKIKSESSTKKKRLNDGFIKRINSLEYGKGTYSNKNEKRDRSISSCELQGNIVENKCGYKTSTTKKRKFEICDINIVKRTKRTAKKKTIKRTASKKVKRTSKITKWLVKTLRKSIKRKSKPIKKKKYLWVTN